MENLDNFNDIELLNAKQVAKITNTGLNKAYDTIRDLNNELKKKGFYIINNRISKAYLLQRIRGL